MSPEVEVFGMLFACVTVAYIAKVVVSAVLRMRELQQTQEMGAIEQRLARIEAAVDAIAIEVERAGELQRFTARVAERGLESGLPRSGRLNTPH